MLTDQQPGDDTGEDTPSGIATETPPAVEPVPEDKPKPEEGDGEVAPEDKGEGEPAAPVAQEPAAPVISAEPTPEEVQRALNTPQGQQYLLESYRALTAQVKSEADAQADKAELEGLIVKAKESGDYSDVGKKLTQRHEEATQTTAARKAVGEEVVSAFSSTVLPPLLNDPEVKAILAKMTPEEKREIDPQNPRFDAPDDMQWYAKYLPVFRSAVQKKAIELAVDEKANAKFEALKQAQANEAAGINAGSGSPDLPTATPGSSLKGTASQLLSKGFEEDREVSSPEAED